MLGTLERCSFLTQVAPLHREFWSMSVMAILQQSLVRSVVLQRLTRLTGAEHIFLFS